MKKIIILAAMISAIATLGACGTPCDALGDAVEAKNSECGVEPASEGEGEGEEAECDEEAAELATCQTACYADAPCEGIAGSDDFDATNEDAIAFFDCLADCSAE